MFKKTFYVILAVIIIISIGLLAYFLIVTYLEGEQEQVVEVLEPERLVYKDQDYGFLFYLPESWRGYGVLTQEWEGLASGEQGETVVTQGPIVVLRHPSWAEENPRQDIPVMVFSIQQWNDLRDGKFHIGAAPIGPSELGRNTTYVFGLPARYNYAFLPGYEEVDQIIQGKAFRAY